MKKNFIYTALFVAMSFPLVASAVASTDGFNTLSSIIDTVGRIIRTLVPIVFTLGILAFFWGLVKYIFAQSSEDGKKDAKNIMLWSLVALFIMASVFGIISLAQTTFGVQNQGDQTIMIPRVEVRQ